MSQTCNRCYKTVERACQSDAETSDCKNLRREPVLKTISTEYGAIKHLGGRDYRFEFKAAPQLNGKYDFRNEQEATDAYLSMAEGIRP